MINKVGTNPQLYLGTNPQEKTFNSYFPKTLNCNLQSCCQQQARRDFRGKQTQGDACHFCKNPETVLR
jgi:hypothetical protein